MHILHKKGPNRGYKRSIYASWEISFDAIRRERPEAAELLLLCGFLTNNDIFETMLLRGLKHASDGGSFFNFFVPFSPS